MTPDLVIFDCDGVLVDTEGPTSRVISKNLAIHGLQISPDRVDSLFTGGTMQDVERTARKMGAELPPDWLDEIYPAIFARLAQGVDVLDGLIDLLDALDRAGVAQFVASNGPMKKMRVSLGPSGLWDRFGGDSEGRILSRENHKPKPDPAMIVHALRQAQVEPDRAVLIDDSPFGCQSALNAGIRCIGLDAYGQGEKLAALGIELAPNLTEARRLLGV